MKKQILFLGVILFGLFGIISCETEGDLPVAKDLKLNRTELSIMQGREGEVTIVSGNGKYELTSSDEEVATASVTGSIIKVKALKVGETKFEVVDGRKKHATFKVTVTELPVLTLAEEKIELTNTKATAEIKDGKVVITAKADEGTVTITVTDANKRIATIEVTLAPAPELSFDKKGTDWQGNPTDDGKVEFILGQTGEVTQIKVLTGTPPYTLAPKYSWSTPDSEYTIDGNVITFTGTGYCSDSYKLTDASGKEKALDVKIYNKISVNPTSYTVLTNQTITGKITVKGKADAFEIKSGYDTNIVTASLEGTSSLERDLKLVGGNSTGSTTITLTDGVNEVSFDVTVEAPKALQIFKGGAEVGTTPYTEDDAKFVIKGGTGEYDVKYTLADGTVTKLLENSTISEVSGEPGSYSLDVSRNKGVREGGEVTVTVTRKDDTSDSKSFKVTCATLSSFEISIDGIEVPKKDGAESPYANPHYTISSGFYGGRYEIYVPVGKTIDFKVLNGTATNYTINVQSYGSQRGEVIETSDNKTFKVKTKEAGAYYVDVMDGTTKVLEMIVRIQ